MPGTFAEWLSWPERTEIVLCELEPTYTLLGFTAVGGGAPNSYQLAFSRFTETTRIPGGLYQKVVDVAQDGVSLTARASLALVDANAGSYLWDEANSLLYVRPTSGAPSSYTMLATLRLYFANAPVVLDNLYYHPWLTGELPHVRRETEDLLSGATSMPSGSVSFTNGHGAWFGLAANDGQWNWKNAKAKFAIGGSYNGQALARADYAQVATMLVEDVTPTEDTCTLLLQPLKRFTELELPVTPYFEGSYPNLGDGVRGTKKWIGYGRAIIPPDLTDTTSSGVYTVADAAHQTLFAIHNVWAVNKSTGARTLLTLTTDYTVDLTACTVTIVNATYAHANYTLAVDVTGKPDGAGSYLSTVGEILKDILQTFLAIGAADIDTAAFAQADLDASVELSLWIKQPRSIASLLATYEEGYPSLGKSTMATLQQTADGKWTCSIWNPFVSGISTTLRREDLARFAPKPKLKRVFSRVQVHYGYDHERQQWSVVEESSNPVKYKTKSNEPLQIFTFLKERDNAVSMAQRYLLLAGGVTVEAEFEERGALLAQKNAGDKLAVTFAPAPTVNGAYDQAPFGILEIDLQMAPKLTVSGRIGNLHGLGGQVGVWMDSAAPAYTAATDVQRQSSGFWCDSAGLANPADPTSGNRSLYW